MKEPTELELLRLKLYHQLIRQNILQMPILFQLELEDLIREGKN